MAPELLLSHQTTTHHHQPIPGLLSSSYFTSNFQIVKNRITSLRQPTMPLRCRRRRSSVAVVPKFRFRSVSAALDLTEDNVKQVLTEARVELAQLFDSSVGITGVVELVELDGPYVTISLRGKFWHKRSDVLARLGNYLKQKIPEILEVDIEDEQQLDDSPENF